MALDVVDAACWILRDMATFDEAGVSQREQLVGDLSA